MHRSRPTCPRPATFFRSCAVAPASIALAFAATITGCARQTTEDAASNALTTALQSWQSLDETGQGEALEAGGRQLGDLILQASGLAAATGMGPPGHEAQIPRLPAFNLPRIWQPKGRLQGHRRRRTAGHRSYTT